MVRTHVELDPGTVALLAVIATALSGVLVVVVLLLSLRLRLVRRAQLRAFAGEERDVLSILGDHHDTLGLLDRDLRALEARADDLRERLRGDVSRVAVVRYDAFEDMGGALSFSAALLDERGNGLVLSAINGRTETRSYAKSVVDRQSEHTLSAEELEAIDAAMSGRLATAPTPSRRRRRNAS